MRRLLIDGDWLLFRGGFAAQRNKYTIRAYELKTEEDRGIAHLPENHRAALKWIKEYDGEKFRNCRFEIEAELEVEPVSHAFANMRTMLDGAMTESSASDSILYIKNSNEKTFRYTVNPDYKGNRDPNMKPFYYDECIWYLKKKAHPIEARPGLEVDDELGIMQWEDYVRCREIALHRTWRHVHRNKEPKTCICTVDKDLDVIPGWHYNPNKNTLYWVTEADAKRTFYTQVLTGDTSDNVKGLFRVGPVAAEKILRGVPLDKLEEKVLEAYREAEGPDGEQRMRTNQALLHILRTPEEMHHDWFNGEPVSLEIIE